MQKKLLNKILSSAISFSLILASTNGTVYAEEIASETADETITEETDTSVISADEVSDEISNEETDDSEEISEEIENTDTSSTDSSAADEDTTDTEEASVSSTDAEESSISSTDSADITFNGSTADIEGTDSVTTTGSDPAVLSITESGTYNLTGNAENIYIAVKDGLEVTFDVYDLSVDNSSSYFIESGNNSTINLILSGDMTATAGSGIISAPKSTVNISGSGSLSSENASDDVIKAKKGNINIESGSITISGAKGDSIKAKNGTVNISGGTITLTECKDDGIQAENVNISGGTINIDTYFENAATGYYSSGKYTSSSSDSYNYLWESGDTTKYERVNVDNGSHKGIKAGTKAKSYVFSDDSSKNFSDDASGSLSITGGTINIDTRKSGLKANTVTTSGYTAASTGTYIIGSPDDAISCNNDMEISGGTLNIYSSDDGISSMGTINITGNPHINIYDSYEGLEGQTINVGSSGNPEIIIYSKDDGINSSGKTLTYTYDTYEGYESDDEINYTKKSVSTSTGNDMNFYNGSITININSENEQNVSIPNGSLDQLKSVTYKSSGDGVDCNGALSQKGCSLYVYGQSSGDNSPIDTNDGYTFDSGAKVLGTGVDGMNESKPDSGSGSYITYGAGAEGFGGGQEPPAQNSTTVEESSITDNGSTPPGDGSTPPGDGSTPPGDSSAPGSGGSFSAGQYWVVLDSSSKVVEYGELKYAGSFIIYGSDTISDGDYTLSVVSSKPALEDIVDDGSNDSDQNADTTERTVTGTFSIGNYTYEYSYTGTLSYSGKKTTLSDLTINGKEAGNSISGNVIFKKIRYKNNKNAGTGYAIPVFKAGKGSDSTTRKAVKAINKYFKTNPLTFTIEERSLADTELSGKATYYSSKGTWKFSLKAKNSDSSLTKLKYKANGTADFIVVENSYDKEASTVQISGTGNYTGTAVISNVIVK